MVANLLYLCISISSMADTFKLDNEEYDVIPQPAVLASKMLVDAYEKAGKPQDIFSTQGQQVMNVIISIWQDLWPLEAKAWFEERKEHLNAEMSIQEQVRKQTGRSLASVPMPIYRMMRKVFPEFRLDSREDAMKLIKHFPIFKMVNRI